MTRNSGDISHLYESESEFRERMRECYDRGEDPFESDRPYVPEKDRDDYNPAEDENYNYDAEDEPDSRAFYPM